MTWFFTADQHIDHPFCAKLRGFSTTYQHDKAILNGYRSVVRGGDVVVLLGDVFWSKISAAKHWSKLAGNKILVKGNHDYWVKHLKIPFRRIYNKTLKIDGVKQHIVCCHYPLLSWNRKTYGALHLHGHCHGTRLPDWHRLDVGVDVAKILFGEYRPFSLEEIMYLLKGGQNKSD